MGKEFKSLADHNFSNYEISNDGVFRHVRTGNLSYGTIDGGYRKRTLVDDNGVSCNKGVHQWIAMAWIPNPMGKKQVDHIDGNRLNNTVTNLRWATSSENMNNMVVNKRIRDKNMKRPYMPKRINNFDDLKFGDHIWTINNKNTNSNIFVYVGCTHSKRDYNYIFMNNTTGIAIKLDSSQLNNTNWFIYENTDECNNFINNVNTIVTQNI